MRKQSGGLVSKLAGAALAVGLVIGVARDEVECVWDTSVGLDVDGHADAEVNAKRFNTPNVAGDPTHQLIRTIRWKALGQGLGLAAGGVDG